MNKPFFGVPVFGWLGLAILLMAESAILLNVSWVATWFTPIMWTGYILFASGISQRATGESWLGETWRELPFMALISVLVWLLFEAYNLHMVNWLYRGLPAQNLWRNIGYLWSFATIMPGVFITYRLVQIIWPTKSPTDDRAVSLLSTGPSWLWFLLGLILVIIPLLLPTKQSAYLFALVWLGFIFLLDPINESMGLNSVRLQWRNQDYLPTIKWLIAGFICGLLWEAWNFQALMAGGGHWVYTVPQALRLSGLHFGQMPIEGLLGFPPFALELRAFYLFLRGVLGGRAVLGNSLLEKSTIIGRQPPAG